MPGWAAEAAQSHPAGPTDHTPERHHRGEEIIQLTAHYYYMQKTA